MFTYFYLRDVKLIRFFFYDKNYLVRHIYCVFETALFSGPAVSERIEILRQKSSSQWNCRRGNA